MDTARRILVHVWKDRVGPQRAPFLQSVTGVFSSGEDQVEVPCSLDRNRFIIGGEDRGARVLLKRPAFCPIKHISAPEVAATPLEVQQRGVDVGVALVLQTSDDRVLLTRRAKELRIFPNVWVPPGGHVEPDETLLDAGLRELQEETGLQLEAEKVSPKILGLWESVYPPLLSWGPPQRHHVVVYMLLRSPLSHLRLQASLTPAPGEVGACLWADRKLIKAIVSAVDGEDGDVDLDNLPTSISVSQVSADGALRDASVPLAVLVSRVPARSPDTERVSTGTKFALELWQQGLHTIEL